MTARDMGITPVTFRSMLLDPEEPGKLYLNLADGTCVVASLHLTGDAAIELGTKLITWGAVANDREMRKRPLA